MVQQLQSVCTKCRGQGEVIKEKDRCKKCRGNKVVQEKKVLEIYIDKGMRHKQKIVFSGEGDQEVLSTVFPLRMPIPLSFSPRRVLCCSRTWFQET
jgi:DnaJ-class molecular chaperone